MFPKYQNDEPQKGTSTVKHGFAINSHQWIILIPLASHLKGHHKVLHGFFITSVAYRTSIQQLGGQMSQFPDRPHQSSKWEAAF